MTHKIGVRLRAANSLVEVILTRAPGVPFEIECGGIAMAEHIADDIRQVDGDEIIVGKRYENTDIGAEVLCVKGGAGPLTVSGEPLTVRAAKPLPSSD